MFGQGNMEQMMKQLGMDVQELEADRVTIETADGRELVFDAPELNRMEVQGQELFQLQGDYEERDAGSEDGDDVELVMERTGASEEEARNALEEHDDLADAVMSLQ
ncbi:MAG: nascent polypeptide-associated complex protein [Candidatus Nanohaloarchaea archaeon]|nr:nascent polypeptide-associated complex protein [Candidatus Nanohaloarchaea archaeon]